MPTRRQPRSAPPRAAGPLARPLALASFPAPMHATMQATIQATILATVLMASLAAGPARAAEAFGWGHPLPAANPLHGVAFADDQHGWAVGIAGVVVRTTDGGDTWHLVPDTWQTLPDLLDVIAVDAATVVAVGGGDGVYRSTDGGATWSGVPVRHDGLLRDLHAVGGRLVAVGEGGVALASDDAGATWTALASPGDGPLSGQHWFDADHGLITAGAFPFFDGFAARTRDGGATWEPVAGVDPGALHDVAFVDAQTGFMVGDFTSYRSDDGGQTWQAASFFFPPYAHELVALPGGAWLLAAFGEGAEVHRSTDQGGTWDRAYDRLAHLGVGDLDRLPGGRLVAVLASGGLVTSDDDGLTWQHRRDDLTDHDGNTLWQVDLVAGGHGWAAGSFSTTFQQDALLLRTHDGGRTWTRGQMPVDMLNVNDLAFRDAVTGFLAGVAFEPFSGLARTTDGGDTWTELSLPGGRDVRRLAVAGPGRVFALAIAAGDAESVWRSDDDGATWQQVSSGLPAQGGLAAFAFLDADHGYVGGGHEPGRVYRTGDGGASWQLRPNVGLGTHVRGLAFADPDTGLARCLDGVYRTTDGGATWQRVVAATGLQRLALTPAGRGAALGHAENSVVVTDDAGATWRSLALPWRGWDPHDEEQFIYFSLGLAGDDLVVGGEFANLLHVALAPVVTGAAPPASRRAAVRAAPNPFNPQTTLHFSLPRAGPARLAVFDLRGRRVRTLVAGRLAAGEHAVRWNGRDGAGRAAPSGVYLVRLAADGMAASTRVLLAR